MKSYIIFFAKNIKMEKASSRTILSENIVLEIQENEIYIESALLPNESIIIRIDQKEKPDKQVLEYFANWLLSLCLTISSIEENIFTKWKTKQLQIQFMKWKQIFHELEHIFWFSYKLPQEINILAWKILKSLS